MGKQGFNVVTIVAWGAGLSTGREQAVVLRQQMNFLTLLSLGLVIQIHG